ncbi:Serpentine Receptor, class BC (Class B-like) [Caenorhabditis elegans]|uniref:Serpentine Receptor, class BC (Class B-like) n=1 Tax=Caenorhabditis elegans TaxID=6239 RepID=O45281_CAEEL|nr:Serpentine Receptor, class BC (Class B-like) [Caenorhabditis elegans]CAB05686.1 Serpentine Receptor, class BC (Class B-like) [Caenorhabditis elegans]|eukprot:NP_507117.1 Serpentine Receptor, class BC (class B-like) [Caenorhabditis elegans]
MLFFFVSSFLAALFSITSCYFNVFILFSILYLKRIPVKSSMSLIYYKLGIDAFYTLSLFFNKLYSILMKISADSSIRNLIFYLIWISTSLGNLRATVALLISFERAVATLFPVFYHNYRQKLSNCIVWFLIILLILFDQYMLFGFCDVVIDTPLDCYNFLCTMNQCYATYWLSHERIFSFSNVFFSAVVSFRLFIWNHFFSTQVSNTISRATRNALFDSFIVIAFNVIPNFMFASFYTIILEKVGELTVATKTAGFMIEALITFQILFGSKKVGPAVVTPQS